MKIPDILTKKEVMELTTLSRSTLYNFIHTNGFPAPKKMGLRVARWSKKEVLKWCEDKGFQTKNL